MKIATVAIVLRKNETEVLLGYKKTGEIGARTINAPGGKCEPGESTIDCVIRETEEETAIRLDSADLQFIAVITFCAAGTPDFEVHFFRTSAFSGIPKETDSFVPRWYEVGKIPFEQMLESDREWFPKVIIGEKFRAKVYYRERAKGFEKIEFFPF